jgi:hypothetical protein
VTGPDGWPDPGWVEANHQFLTAALEAIRHRVSGADATAAAQRCEELAKAMSTPPAADGVAAAFGLSGFERDVLLLCAGVELETAVARACATAHGDPARPYATFSLAMGTLPDSHWSATTPAAPLRRWHLVELSHPELPTASPLRIDERMLHALTGIAYLDPRIEVLAEPLPPADIRLSYAMAYYARGVAHAAKQQWAEAQAALDTVTAINAATPDAAESKMPLSVAVHALTGEIATRRGDVDAGITHFREALRIEDAGLYFEPPKWYYPVRHSLGAALLKAGRNAEAERVYREDLRRFPENGWALFGLAQALKAQGKDGEAARVDARFKQAWADADVTLVASRF